MAVGMSLNNGASSGQSKSLSGHNSTSVRKPNGINTTLDVTSNIGHGVTPKTSNTSVPHSIFGIEIMALLEQKEVKGLNVMQQFTEEMCLSGIPGKSWIFAENVHNSYFSRSQYL
eukprot:8892245-Ditylum_brightwellii.AAC.1